MSRFEFRPSPLLAVLIVFAHGLAGGSALLVLQSVEGALLAGALLGLGAAAAWSRALLRGRSGVRALEVDGEGVCLELATGVRVPAEVSGRRYVGQWLVSLPVRRPSRRTLLVTRDMLDGDSFRLLRLWALWGRLPVAGAPRTRAGAALP